MALLRASLSRLPRPSGSPLFPARPQPSMGTSVAPFSTNHKSLSLNPLDWWKGRQERSEAAKYKERLQSMADKEQWTIGDMQAELAEVERSWLAKLQDTAELRQARDLHATVQGMVQVLGQDATDEQLAAMTRRQKLQVAAHVGTGVEPVNHLIQQFQTMGLMHRVLRHRRELGKPIPTTSEAMQSVMQVEGPKLMSPAHKKAMLQVQQKRMKRALVQRRR